MYIVVDRKYEVGLFEHMRDLIEFIKEDLQVSSIDGEEITPVWLENMFDSNGNVAYLYELSNFTWSYKVLSM